MKEAKAPAPAQPSAAAAPPGDARCIVYTRVSTEDQAAPDKASLADQERECRAYAEQHGWTVDYLWTDAGVSGRDEARLERLTRWCEQHPRRDAQGGRIVALNASRWGRFVHNPHTSEFFKYRLRKAGWLVEFPQQPSTGHRTTDGVLGVIHDAQAAQESEEKGYRARMGMVGAAEKGYWTGRPPFGYQRVAVDQKTTRERKLEAYEHAAGGERVKLIPGPARDVATVEEVFRLAARGVPLEQIAKRLNQLGTPGPWRRYGNNWRSGKAPEWTLANVKAILTNPAYLGDLVFGRRAPDDDGERREAPREEWVVVENAWPALVDRPTWGKINAAIGARKGQRRPRVVRYVLSGMVICTRCGSRLIGGGGSRPTATDPARFAFYKCPRCREPRVYVSRALLEGQVSEIVTAHVREVVRTGFDRALNEALAALRRRGAGHDQEAQRERAVVQLRQQRDNLVAAVARGTLREDEARTMLETVRRDLEALEVEQHAGRFALRRWTLTTRERAQLKAMALNFPQQLARADLATARALLGYWIADAYVDSTRRTGRVVLRRAPLAGLDGLATKSEAGRS
jgi:DNA invertase Pin-like site-specific DNA recombinase